MRIYFFTDETTSESSIDMATYHSYIGSGLIYYQPAASLYYGL